MAQLAVEHLALDSVRQRGTGHLATHVNVEAGGEFKVSAAEYVLGQL